LGLSAGALLTSRPVVLLHAGIVSDAAPRPATFKKSRRLIEPIFYTSRSLIVSLYAIYKNEINQHFRLETIPAPVTIILRLFCFLARVVLVLKGLEINEHSGNGVKLSSGGYYVL
jgi:hypothetical protein